MMNNLQEQLLALGTIKTFKTKKERKDLLDHFQWPRTFPWHEEQKQVLDLFFSSSEKKEMIVQGIFGNGKTTLMMGIFVEGLLRGMYKSNEVIFCAFNVGIRNELRQKLKVYKFKKKPACRTFDSLIYHICKDNGYGPLDVPNFEGRRRFVEELLKTKPTLSGPIVENNINNNNIHPPPPPPSSYDNIRQVFVDEAQDLDYRSYAILQSLFPNASFFFMGDLFQCIQKEPRASVLWHLLYSPPPPVTAQTRTRHTFVMTKTPRVPTLILDQVKDALTQHYPAHASWIEKWTSLSKETECAIGQPLEWKPFKGYGKTCHDIHREMETRFPWNETMILTFSSAITVRGSMGDLSRVRRYFSSHYPDIPINTNYKRMEEGKLYLSTTNSSKGLERNYVILILTFPLEKAFANFSNDLVMNLISVGISRAKKQVLFYIPQDDDRFSQSLQKYKLCPAPSLPSRNHPPPSTPMTSSSTSLPKNPEIPEIAIWKRRFREFVMADHSATEIIRQQIISYDVRTACLNAVDKTFFTTLFPSETARKWPPMHSEEQVSFWGSCVEQLITCEWTRKWPPHPFSVCSDSQRSEIQSLSSSSYGHVSSKIFQFSTKYTQFMRESYQASTRQRKFEILYFYTRLEVLIKHRVDISEPPSIVQQMYRIYLDWAPMVNSAWKDDIVRCFPPSIKPKWEIQKNGRLANMTGVMDAFVSQTSEKSERLENINNDNNDNNNNSKFKKAVLVEIKTCRDWKWKDNAFFQSFLYMMSLPQYSTRLLLLNPLRNEYVQYRMKAHFPYYSLRSQILSEMMLWNTNCFLAKTATPESACLRQKTIRIETQYIVNIPRSKKMEAGNEKEEETYRLNEVTVVEFFTETQLRILSSSFSLSSEDQKKLGVMGTPEQKKTMKTILGLTCHQPPVWKRYFENLENLETVPNDKKDSNDRKGDFIIRQTYSLGWSTPTVSPSSILEGIPSFSWRRIVDCLSGGGKEMEEQKIPIAMDDTMTQACLMAMYLCVKESQLI